MTYAPVAPATRLIRSAIHGKPRFPFYVEDSDVRLPHVLVVVIFKGETMTYQIEDDIVRRALIALLAPDSFASGSAPNTYVRKSKFRRQRGTASRACEPIVAEPVPTHISIVEQLTSQTLSVCWSDPQSGHYADQVWRKGVARTASFCVLTGVRIYPGDSVFRPRACEQYVPANRDRMIHAAALIKDPVLMT
jgi:hypothetical protein